KAETKAATVKEETKAEEKVETKAATVKEETEVKEAVEKERKTRVDNLIKQYRENEYPDNSPVKILFETTLKPRNIKTTHDQMDAFEQAMNNYDNDLIRNVSEILDKSGNTISDGISSASEAISESYDNIAQFINETFKDFPDIGEITLDNGEKLELEYDAESKSVYVDTTFFDGIFDYKQESVSIDFKKCNTEEGLRKQLIEKDVHETLKTEYLKKVEEAEQSEMYQDIKDVLQGNKLRKTIETVTVNDEEMGVVLFRDRKGNVKLKLDTPYGDGVSDKDTEIIIAKVGGKISMTKIGNFSKEITAMKHKYEKDVAEYKKNATDPEEVKKRRATSAFMTL
ncbi:MAG: hypothetical protein GY828_00565, partial [Candidatus Gracilibacteria bacterium]|nr:hypothetical protein [Candidatus Gracilibacteria bacterium]